MTEQPDFWNSAFPMVIWLFAMRWAYTEPRPPLSKLFYIGDKTLYWFVLIGLYSGALLLALLLAAGDAE
jgi:hypothetical protein